MTETIPNLHPEDLVSTIARQTRVRYRFKCGRTTYYDGRGFRNRAEVDSWIDQQISKFGLSYRVGYYVALRGFEHPFSIVNNRGEELKP